VKLDFSGMEKQQGQFLKGTRIKLNFEESPLAKI
jgi:hypothetical protein